MAQITASDSGREMVTGVNSSVCCALVNGQLGTHLQRDVLWIFHEASRPKVRNNGPLVSYIPCPFVSRSSDGPCTGAQPPCIVGSKFGHYAALE
jgi:hypothetical protein